MSDCMRFPDTVEEFMDQYKVVDREGIYMSKGSELVPIFRMNQWFEHEKAQLSQEGTISDTISRQATIRAVNNAFDRETLLTGFVRSIAVRAIRDMPSAQPEPKTGVWLTYTNIPQYMLCKCSACGADILVPYLGKNTIFNYCPNCGTKMEGDLN